MDEDPERGADGSRSSDDVSDSSERPRPVSPDRILAAVANEQRRDILRVLDGASEGILAYDALVDHIADRRRNRNGEQPLDEHRHTVQIELRHTHLPKLAEARMVDYDAEADRVEFVAGDFERDILSLLEQYDGSTSASSHD